SLDFLPPNISVNSTVRGEPRMGDFVGGVRLEKYCYSLVHLTDYDLTLRPHAFAEQVIGRQLKKVKKDIADHLWSQFDLDHQYEVVFTPPRRVKDAVVLQGDIPLRWMVVEEMGEVRSTDRKSVV